MPLQLPEPDQTPLPRSPLDAVICQLRYEPQSRASDATVALAVREALGGEELYPQVEPVQTQTTSLLMGSGVMPAISGSSGAGWRLHAADQRWFASVMPDFVSVETTRYETWEPFRDRMLQLVAAVSELLAPGLEQRLGLRYVDRVTVIDAETPREWEPYLARELLGLVLNETLGSAVTAARQQLVFDLGDGFKCAFTHGFLQRDDGHLDYLLDYDLSREGSRQFSADAIGEALETMHLDALKLFYASISEELLQLLREPQAA